MINQQYNIAQRILTDLQKDSNKVIFETKRGPMTAGRFANMIISFGIHLQHRGISQGNVILDYYDITDPVKRDEWINAL